MKPQQVASKVLPAWWRHDSGAVAFWRRRGLDDFPSLLQFVLLAPLTDEVKLLGQFAVEVVFPPVHSGGGAPGEA